MSIKVSVIVPVYNTYEYLERCLDSLVSQTMDDIEIIVINDGSSDKSQDIIDEYVALYPGKIRGFYKENEGVSSARNAGIMMAKGDYLGFVDSDDYVDSDFFERMHQKAIETDSDIVSSPITYVFADHETKVYYEKERFGKNVREDGYILLKANGVSWNKIYRTSFWKENGFFFPEQWYEDDALIYNVMLMANKISCVNIPFYCYTRDREGSIVNTIDPRIYDVFKSTDSIISFYKEHGAFEELYETIEEICFRHIFGRIETLRDIGNRHESNRFVSHSIRYLDKNFKNWRKCSFLQHPKDASIDVRLYTTELRHSITLKRFAANKTLLSDILKRHITKRNKKKADYKKNSSEKRRKREKAISKYGLCTLHDVQTILKSLGVLSFADDDTCLALTCDKGLLAKSDSIKIGVYPGTYRQQNIHTALERAGYKLYWSCSVEDVAAAEVYRIRNVEVKLIYYKSCKELFKVWYFPDNLSSKNQGNRVNIKEIEVSPIIAVQESCVDNVKVFLPENFQLLMNEKYGSDWMKTGETGVVSMQGKTLLKQGICYRTYYSKHEKKDREAPTAILIDNKIDGTVDWDKAIECADKGYNPVVIGSKTEVKKNAHPRILTYTGDINDKAFLDDLEKKICGNNKLNCYSETKINN